MVHEDEHVLSMVEWLLLAAILKNDNNAYGSAIYVTAKELAHPAKVSYGSLYPTLERLERQGLLSSTFSEPIKQRGGRSRRYFAVTAAGQAAMKRSGAMASRITWSMSEVWGMA